MNKNKKFVGIKELYDNNGNATMHNSKLKNIIDDRLKKNSHNDNYEINDIFNEINELENKLNYSNNVNRSDIERDNSRMLNFLNSQQGRNVEISHEVETYEILKSVEPQKMTRRRKMDTYHVKYLNKALTYGLYTLGNY